MTNEQLMSTFFKDFLGFESGYGGNSSFDGEPVYGQGSLNSEPK